MLQIELPHVSVFIHPATTMFVVLLFIVYEPGPAGWRGRTRCDACPPQGPAALDSDLRGIAPLGSGPDHRAGTGGATRTPRLDAADEDSGSSALATRAVFLQTGAGSSSQRQTARFIHGTLDTLIPG